MILIIDNFDSFTYNIYQYVGGLYEDIRIFRNNQITIKEIRKLNPSGIIISPGPKTPSEAGISMDVIKHFYKTIPILGICLGHQAIGQVFGGKIVRSDRIMHGKTSNINHENTGIFKGLNNPLKVMRYHSLIIDKYTMPKELDVISETLDGEVMAIKHKYYPVFGVQFHPESVFTEDGIEILKNFINVIEIGG